MPTKASRAWLYPVMLNGIEYGIPLTTQDSGAGYAGYLRCGAVPDHGLYLRYMIPIPERALQPPKPLPPELKAELTYWEENRKYLEAEARILYRLSGIGQMDRFWQRHSCDFHELDSVYFNWQPGYEAGLFLYPNEEVQDMPISKNGKAYYTKEQYQAAKYESNALEYAQSQGYDLVNENGWYKLREHNSMVFSPDGRWYWNSRDLSGRALEFMIYYENRTVVDAVLTLTNDPEYTRNRPAERNAAPQSAAVQPAPRTATTIPKDAFKLPEKAQNCKLLFYYLCAQRGLDKSVVQEMIRQNRLYQSAYARPDGKILCNATFVYQDSTGKPVGAYQRGMADREGVAPYKRDVPGSDKSWGWQLAGNGAVTTVAVFEGAIDAASDASLTAMQCKDDSWKAIDRLSLEGVGMQPLLTYLQNHPNVREVTLMLDADDAGRRAASQIAQKLQAQGYKVNDVTPPFGKDWNEVLVATRDMEAEQMEHTPQPEVQEIG